MFKIVTVSDNVRVLPTKFGFDLKEAVRHSLQEQIEGKIDPNIGVFLAVLDILKVGEGKIIPEDGAVYYDSEFEIMVFSPEMNEIVLGEVVDITEFGAFVRIGPIDALAHVSQIIDDRISYDQKNTIFTGKKSGNRLKEGDFVRARIVGVSLSKGRNKVSLTMRQPSLGALGWIDKEKKKKLREKAKPSGGKK